MKDQPSITIRDLYPNFTDEQLQQAETTFRRYIAVMARIYERVRAEQGIEEATRLAYGDGNLTVPASSSTIPDERSNSIEDH
jgi:hypothetical protein